MMSAYFPLTETFFEATVPASFARGWEIFVRPRGVEDEEIPVYGDEVGGSELSQPLLTGPAGRIGEGEAFGWVSGADLPVDIWGRPKGRTDVEWQVLPFGDLTAAGTQALAEAEAVKQELEDKTPEVYAADFGAKGGGVDETAAIQKAITALPTRGGVIRMSGATFNFTSLDLSGRRSVVFAGVGGLSAGATPGTILNCIATEGIGIDVRSTSGVIFTDMAIRSDVVGYTGNLIDASHGEGVSPEDTSYLFLERCRVASGQTTCTLLNLDKTILSGGDGVVFQGGAYGVVGKAEESSYSNAIGFTRTTFVGQGTAAILNPGESWYINGWLEPLASGAANPIKCTTQANGLTLVGVWTGDDNGEGSWLEFHGRGLVVEGGNWQGGATTIITSSTSVGISIVTRINTAGTPIKLTKGTTRVLILADIIGAKGIDFDTGTPAGLVLTGENDDVSFHGLTLDADATTRVYRRAAGIVHCAGTLESGVAMRTSQGEALSLTLSEDAMWADGTSGAQNLAIDSKGSGAVQINTRKAATGGTQIEGSGGKVGFLGAAPVTRRAVKPPGEVTAKELCEALEALGLVS